MSIYGLFVSSCGALYEENRELLPMTELNACFEKLWIIFEKLSSSSDPSLYPGDPEPSS